MKILFILGSPRKHGNTSKIINEVKQKLGTLYVSELCHITDFKVNGCLGCSKCQEDINEIACVQNDETEHLLKKLIDADIIIYGTPLYGHSYSGQLKVFLDRHVALFKFIDGGNQSVEKMEIHSLLRNKLLALIVTCQGPEKHNTELIQNQFNMFCASSLTVCVGQYIFPYCATQVDSTIYSETVLQQIVDDIKSRLSK